MAASFSIFVLVLLASSQTALCWDDNEMEVFDAYEEVNENFYTLMGINEDATLSDIKRAYRTLSKQLHPDKNDAPDAEIKFRQMVQVYEVLKDADKRRIYNRVLIDGPPDWRHAIYYYRRARKMSMMEIALILTLVISIAQYLMAWGTYWDKWRTLEYHSSRKQKKKKKKPEDEGKESETLEDLYLGPKPSMLNILPVQVVVMSYNFVRYGPSIYRKWREEQHMKETLLQQQKQREEEEEKQRLAEEEERKARKASGKKRRKNVIPERKDVPRESGDCILHAPEDPYEAAAAGLNTGLWSTEEFSELAKLMNKYPGGTLDRWEVIAQHLNRSTYEVTKMAQKVKEKMAAGSWLQEQEEAIHSKVKVKTRSANVDEATSTSSDAHWNAVQQKALEKSLKLFPKGTDQRWERIAKQVPGKTSEDCINRFKFLAERIKRKKEEEAAPVTAENQDKQQENEGEKATASNENEQESDENARGSDEEVSDEEDEQCSDEEDVEEYDSEDEEAGATESD